MIPLIDSTKTPGVVFRPGAMVGTITAGADHIWAVRFRIVVLYMLLGSVSAMTVGLPSYRSFFTAVTSSGRRRSGEGRRKDATGVSGRAGAADREETGARKDG